MTFALHPAPERAGRCPRDERELRVNRLRLPGWRMLLDGTCDVCGHRYLQDLPAGHGLVYPATLDLDTGETFDAAGATWFSSWLRQSWEDPDPDPVALSVEQRDDAAEVVLLNCLDPVYGHALLKLLNVQRELDGGPTVVLIPSSLTPLVPDGVAEVWTIDERPGRFRGWVLELEERLPAELERFRRVTLSPAYPHPHPTTYDLERLVARVEPERPGDPSIVLSFRDDRLWGRDADAQRENVERLTELVREAFPAAALTPVGPGAAAPSEADERRWLALMRGADLAIGVHGSNLLLPSGLAQATVELIGEERYGNVFQGTLLGQLDPVVALGKHRVVYGASDLADVTPHRVAAVALSVLREGDRFHRLMAGPASGLAGTLEPIPASPPPVPEPGPKGRPTLGGVIRRTRAAVSRPPKLPEPPAVLADRRGFRFELERPEEIAQFADHDGHFEADEIELAAQLLRPGETAIDAGANIGAFTAAFAAAVGAEGRVHAFEPLEGTRRRLARTLELNAIENVVVDPRALSDEAGTAEIYEYGAGFESWATLSAREIEYEGTVLQTTVSAIATTTLDAYAAEAGLGRIALLKIDVEGAEQRVLAGAAGLLGSGRIAAVAAEVSDNTLEAFDGRARDVIELFESYGLRPFVVRDGRLRAFRIAGVYRELANVFALSPSARERV